ncbi:tetratricopeptide repeat protein [Aliishimia ponticola]|nr:tetratricopeptide repeat protein [Aliishimia ponticola]
MAQAQTTPHDPQAEYDQAMAEKRFAAAADTASQLIAQNPVEARFHAMRAEARIKAGKAHEALADMVQANALAPDTPDFLSTLGSLLLAHGDQSSGEACFQRALQLEPNHLMSALNLGRHFEKTGRAQDAERLFMQALVAHPESAAACHLTGRVLHFQGKREQAAALFLRAIENDPTLPEPYRILAAYLREAGDLKSAIGMYDALLRQCPDDLISVAERAHCLAHICDWNAPGYRDFTPGLPEMVTSGAAPFLFLAFEDDPAHQRIRSERYAKRLVGTISAAKPAPPAHDKIRVGYFSADFHTHATMHLMAGMLEAHDRTRFELYAYSFGPDIQDAMRKRAVYAVDCFTDITGMSDYDAAALARAHGLDIAIDLKGFTGGTRPAIFAHRAAPVQIAWLGFPGTTGAKEIDYIIADKVVIPPKERRHYSEKILTLPGCYQPNDNTRPLPDPGVTRADVGLPAEGLVFCCFNGSYKISPVEFDIWMDLLREVDGSVLWLLDGGEVANTNLHRAAEASGIDYRRIIFAPKMKHDQHLSRTAHADLFLDTFNCNAHTTASDALWAGVPVLTLPGCQFAARVAASLVTAIGTPETVCDSVEQYRAKALDYARNPEKLAHLRQKLEAARQTAPLFDTEGFTRAFEDALRSTQKTKKRR